MTVIPSGVVFTAAGGPDHPESVVATSVTSLQTIAETVGGGFHERQDCARRALHHN